MSAALNFRKERRVSGAHENDERVNALYMKDRLGGTKIDRSKSSMFVSDPKGKPGLTSQTIKHELTKTT